MRKFTSLFICLVFSSLLLISASFVSRKKTTRQGYIPKNMVLIPGNDLIRPFYMERNEEYNKNYLIYLEWLRTVFCDYQEVFEKSKPDSAVWSRFYNNPNDPYLRNYLWHPAFADYPIVGVSWVQANDYCRWKTDRLNESILIREKFLWFNPYQVNEDNFNIEAYLAWQYNGDVRKKILKRETDSIRDVFWSDKILLPMIRLPTEAEWEYANTYSKINKFGKEVKRRLQEQTILNVWYNFWEKQEIYKRGYYYDTFSHHLVPFENKNKQFFNPDSQNYLPLLSYYYDVDETKTLPRTSSVYGIANDITLFHMNDNVSEWVFDKYETETGVKFQNLLTVYELNGQGVIQKNDSYLFDSEGWSREKDSLGRVPYRILCEDEKGNPVKVYSYGHMRKISGIVNDDKSTIGRIYRGGSWIDNESNKRGWLSEDSSAVDIGLRCVMSWVK